MRVVMFVLFANRFIGLYQINFWCNPETETHPTVIRKAAVDEGRTFTDRSRQK
jgi:hypothetical protein